MNKDNGNEDIKSVNIRAVGIERRLLMSSSMVLIFQSFLRESIGNEVVVVNTNIGMEVYYYSENDFSNFIRESILLYTLKHIESDQLKFRNHLNRDEVYRSFFEALITFTQYPQIFLAYSKKFIHLQQQNSSGRYVMPILNSFFEETLTVLAETSKIPHYEKIMMAQKKSQKSKTDHNVIQELIAEILLKKHSN